MKKAQQLQDSNCFFRYRLGFVNATRNAPRRGISDYGDTKPANRETLSSAVGLIQRLCLSSAQLNTSHVLTKIAYDKSKRIHVRRFSDIFRAPGQQFAKFYEKLSLVTEASACRPPRAVIEGRRMQKFFIVRYSLLCHGFFLNQFFNFQ